jgi:hypothetical protein
MSDAHHERFPDTFLHPSYVVLDSAVLRGAITAMGWLTRGGLRIKSCPTLPEALRETLARLEELGIAPPAGLDPESYRFPAPDSAASG